MNKKTQLPAESVAASCSAEDCEHDWKEEYYGTRCSKCNTFYPTGCEPWMPDDDALSELQAIETIGDDLRDGGMDPDAPTMKCVRFNCDYAPLIYLKKEESKQTQNGFLIAKVDGWYCPVCACSYGPMTPPNAAPSHAEKNL